MPNPEQNQDSDFMIEKIKERPVNKRKLLRRTVITASLAVVFGLIACLTFLILEPVFNNWLYPEEKPQMVELPEETEEIQPEDMLVQNQPEEPVPDGEMILEEEQLEEILSGMEWTIKDYNSLHSSLAAYANEMSKSMVTITAAVSNMDWFNEAYESEGASSGILFFNNARELLILADYTMLVKADTLTATFYDGTEVPAQIKQYDGNTNLAVVAVSLSELEKDFVDRLPIAALGTSNTKNMAGMPVVIVGSPTGVPGSVCYGNITTPGTTLYMADANYKLLQTDVYGSKNSSGAIFDLQGRVLGILTNGKIAAGMDNMVTAYGISELKKVMTKMGNGREIAYLGIEGTDVTVEANEELDVPYGAYIREIFMDSPAMKAGIQRGDVIIELGEVPIAGFSDYAKKMLQLSPGSTVTMKVMRQVQTEYKEMTFDVTVDSTK